MYNEKITPNNIPVNVAIKPIKNPVRKKDFIIEFLESPRDFRIAISLVLFLIKIVRPDIILKAEQ